MQKLPDAERKRNCLCIRWDDASHRLVSDEAYKRRTNCSELIRQIVLERLPREEVKAEQSQAV